MTAKDWTLAPGQPPGSQGHAGINGLVGLGRRRLPLRTSSQAGLGKLIGDPDLGRTGRHLRQPRTRRRRSTERPALRVLRARRHLGRRRPGFRLDLDKLFDACDERTRAIFLVSPANPTGWIAAPDEQAAILDFCRRRGIWLIADEVYHRFVYDSSPGQDPEGRLAAPSLLALADPEDPVFVVNSFSKTWAMTGWRMGWLTHPPSLGPLFDNLIEFNTSGGQAFIQRAGIAALEEGEPFVVDYIERCRRAGDLVFQRLSAMPRVRIARPRGSFYSFFGLDGMDDSFAFAKDLLTETGVGLAPGSAFGAGGEGYLRLCFATSAARLSEALDRIEPKLT